MIHEGRRRMLYFLPLPEGGVERSAMINSIDDVDLQGPRLRPFSEIAKVLSLVPIPRMHKNKRLSSLEKRRRQIVESYRVLMRQQSQQLDLAAATPSYAKFVSFLLPITPADREYLDGNASVQQRSRPPTKSSQHQETDSWEGCLGMATSRRHWVEYYLVLSKSEACFYHKHHMAGGSSGGGSGGGGSQRTSSQRGVARRPAMRINMSSVVSVQPMRFQDIPLQGFSFFQIETFSRVYYFMVRSDIQLHEWIEAFVHCLGKDVLHSPFDDSFYNLSLTQPGVLSSSSARFHEPEGEAYLAKSACWKLDKKRIFNYRRIIFNPAAIPSKYSGMSPNAFIEAILANVLFLSNTDNSSSSSGQNSSSSNNNNSTAACTSKSHAFQWVKFMDEISWLQCINVSKLSETERIAFFLNLYHVMVLHGSLVVGPPPAWNYWNAFFNNITYLFGYEIISIADIEFNILR